MYIKNHEWKEGIVFWDQEIDKSKDIDVYYLLHEFDKGRGENISTHTNFRTKLDTNEPESRFSSTTRNLYRRTIGIFEYDLIKNPSEEELLNFESIFNGFADFKGLTHIDINFLKQIKADNKLWITKASKDGVVYQVHSFYVSQGIARLLHSVSTVDNEDRNSNIGLHRFELSAFMSEGINTYDWGGAGFINETNPKKLAIKEYKRKFGGEEYTYYKARIAGNEKGKKIIAERYKY